jgi:hypothetical protein
MYLKIRRCAMGMKLFSSSSNDDNYCRKSVIEPRADLFNITKEFASDGGISCVVMINYPNCVNYEGNKICVYKKSLPYIRKQSLLDPHFSNKGLAPFARFEPTDAGWVMAVAVAMSIK